MNNNLKNIPSQFLKNSSLTNDYNTTVYISSTEINKKKQSIQNDNIWILIIILIIFDII